MKIIALLFVLILCSFIQNTNSNKIAFLVPESNYDEIDLPKNAQNIEFVGLFESKTGFYAQKTKIKIINTENIQEDDSQKRIKVKSKDECKLVILNKKINDHPFKRVILNNDNPIDPNFNESFDYLGKTYTVYAMGTKTNSTPNNPGYYDVSNYKLYISTVKNGKKITQLIYAVKKFEERLPSNIELAGDIDGDGLLDLYMEASGHYAGAKYVLFLSSNATYNEVFHLVAEYQFMGC